jgi:hypothetical protein
MLHTSVRRHLHEPPRRRNYQKLAPILAPMRRSWRISFVSFASISIFRTEEVGKLGSLGVLRLRGGQSGASDCSLLLGGRSDDVAWANRDNAVVWVRRRKNRVTPTTYYPVLGRYLCEERPLAEATITNHLPFIERLLQLRFRRSTCESCQLIVRDTATATSPHIVREAR